VIAEADKTLHEINAPYPPHIRLASNLHSAVMGRLFLAVMAELWLLVAAQPGSYEPGAHRVLMTAVQTKSNLRAELTPGLLRAFSRAGYPIPVAGIESATNTPIHFLLFIESNRSATRRAKFEPALEQSEFLVRDYVAEAGDVTAYAFSDTAERLVTRSTELSSLHDKFRSLPYGKKACLLETLLQGIRETPRDDNRQVAIVISNGEDDCSSGKEKQVIENAEQKSVVIYALDTHFSLRKSWGTYLMERITVATGGRLLYPENAKAVEQSFSRLRSDLLSQYWVTLGPPGRARKFQYLGRGVELLYPR